MEQKKAAAGYLGAIWETGICILRFRDLKPKNTLHWMQVKVGKIGKLEKRQIKIKN